MSPGISISVVWFDEDILELRIGASNGRFAGEIEAYAPLDACRQLADTLKGFPLNASDIREFEVGTFDSNNAGGGARIRFHCTNGAGHAAADISVRTDPQHVGGTSETASFSINIEAAAVDTFVQQLRDMRLEDGQSTHLSAV